jgi:hypothetical protein
MYTRKARRASVALGILLLVAAVAVAIAASTSSASPGSTPLHGKMRGIANFFPPACTSVTGVCSSFEATGSINGSGVVQVDTFPSADGISKAHTVIHTSKGDLRCHEQAIFDLAGADHAFVDLCLIDGGTGTYAGASGYIQEVGTFDFANNVGELDYYGKIVYGS